MKRMKQKSNNKWRTVLALVMMYVIFIMNWEWMWGILFLIWVIPDLITGSTYFVEAIHKKENPLLYWMIVISWIIMALFSLSTLVINYNQYYY